MRILFVMTLYLGCDVPDDNPRLQYNDGLNALNEARYEEASEKLLDARDRAMGDGKLRQYSSYNLALSHARLGMQQEAEDPQKASEQYGHAVAWFRDSLQLNRDDEEARTNLEVVLKRLQLLADRLNSGNNSLEKRLERLLDDSRTLRDQVRTLDVQIDAGTDPESLDSSFEQLAIQVRSLQAEASTTIQLSSNEKSNIEGKAEDQRSDEEKMRMAQLGALSVHLEEGRDQIADARRVLRRLDVDKSLDRLGRAVRTIHRAREQLLDPLVVLQTLAQEESQLTQQTRALVVQKNPGLFLSPQDAPPKLPSWFDSGLLSEEQGNIHERCDEILQRFSFSMNAEQETTSEDSEQAEFMALVRDAVPPLANAVVFMKSAQQALMDGALSDAVQQEYKVQQELSKAIERFADAKNLIELLYQTQQGLVALVTPPTEEEELPISLSAEERMDAVQTGLQENISRIERLDGALRREKKKQLAQLPPQEEGSEPDSSSVNIEEVFTRAEKLRGQVYDSLRSMEEAIAVQEPVVIQAEQAEASLQELRILFFSVVEHLKLLLEEQGTLRDESGVLLSDSYERMIEGLGMTIATQGVFAERAGSIAEVLQKQADTAAQGEDQEKAGSFAEAYAQTSVAQTAMQDTIDLLTQVRSEEGGVSHDPLPSLDLQQEAMEALMAAIQALQPPQENQDQGEDEQKEQQEQQEQMSKQQAERRLQAAKEREAERAKKRQEASSSEPVEKDW
jgi:hypothetical protein